MGDIKYIPTTEDQLSTLQALKEVWGDLVPLEKTLTEQRQKDLRTAKEQLSVEGKISEDIRQRLKDQETLADLTEKVNKQRQIENVLNKQSNGLISDTTKVFGGYKKLSENFNLSQLLFYGKQQYFSRLLEESFGQIGLRFATVVFFAKEIWKQFTLWDSVSSKFRVTMGVFRDDIADIKYDAFNLAKSLADIGVTLEDIVGNTLVLSAKFGSVYNVNKDVLKTITLMETSLGVSAENSSRVLQIFGSISKTTMASNKNALLFMKSLANAAGQPLDALMKDVASLSGDALALVSKMPLQLAKAAVEARRFGTSIAELSAAAGSTLDFSSSIAKEMEASVLLGRSINLQAAREAAYRGDMVEYLRQIRGIIKTTDFESLDFFQKKSVAEALGQSVDSLMAMSQSSREIDAALSGSNDRAKKMAQEYQRLVNLNQERVNSEAKSVEYQLQTKNNQERIASIASKWNKLMMELGRVFLPIIDAALGFMADHFNTIVSIGGALYAGWKLFNGGLTKTMEFLGRFRKLFTLIPESIGGLVGKFGSFLKLAGRIVIPLVFAWNIFQEIKKILNDPVLMGTKGFFAFNGKLILRAIGAIVRALWTTFNDLFFGLPGLIAKGLGAAGDYIFGSIAAPFKAVWAWLSKTFLGNSPSQLGLGIVKGILSVNQMIMDALMLPFKMFISWASKLPVIGKLIGQLGSIEAKVSSPSVASNITPVAQTSPTQQSKQVATAEKTQEAANLMTNETGQMIVKKIDELITAMKNGGIGINMDGQLLSATLARQTEFRGGFGVNKV